MKSTASPKSLRRMSRASGELYASVFLLAPLGFIVGKMAVTSPGPGRAAAEELAANESLYRIGMVAEIGVVIVELVLAALLYALVRPVSRSLALGAALTRAAEAIVQAINLFPATVALAAATGTGVYADVSLDSRDLVVRGAMDTYEMGIYIWGIPFALHVLFLGLLVVRSGVMPKLIGWAMVVASAGYFADSLAPIGLPAASSVTENFVLIVAIPAELAFAVWLIAKGLRADVWQSLQRGDDGAPGEAGAESSTSEPVAESSR